MGGGRAGRMSFGASDINSFRQLKYSSPHRPYETNRQDLRKAQLNLGIASFLKSIMSLFLISRLDFAMVISFNSPATLVDRV